MWTRHAQRGRYLRENSRSPCREQVCSRSDLLVGRFGRQHRPTKPLKRIAKQQSLSELVVLCSLRGQLDRFGGLPKAGVVTGKEAILLINEVTDGSVSASRTTWP